MSEPQGRPWRFVATAWAVILLILAIGVAQGMFFKAGGEGKGGRRYMPATKADAGEGAVIQRAKEQKQQEQQLRQEADLIAPAAEPTPVTEPTPAAFPATKSGVLGRMPVEPAPMLTNKGLP